MVKCSILLSYLDWCGLSSCNMFGDVIRQSGWNTSEVCIAAKQGRLTKFVFFFFKNAPFLGKFPHEVLTPQRHYTHV